MKGISITIDDVLYEKEAILAPCSPSTDTYADVVLSIARAWLQGETHFVLHTSGSTKDPKPVLLTRTQMIASTEATLQYLAIPPRMAFGSCVDVRFIGGMMQIIRALHAKRPLIVLSPSRKALTQLPKGRNLGLVSVVPLQLHYLLTTAQTHCLSTCGITLVGGGAISAQMEQQLSTLPYSVYHSYGMTETASHIALKCLTKGEDSFSALPGIYLRRNAAGCLEVKGKVTHDHWVNTGDEVRMARRNAFVWIGRQDAVINTGGIKVNLDALDRQIGTLFASMQDVREYFTYGLADEALGTKIVLVLEETKSAVNEENMLKKLKEYCARYHAPRALYIADKFIRTPSGKVDKAATMKEVFSPSGLYTKPKG